MCQEREREREREREKERKREREREPYQRSRKGLKVVGRTSARDARAITERCEIIKDRAIASGFNLWRVQSALVSDDDTCASQQDCLAPIPWQLAQLPISMRPLVVKAILPCPFAACTATRKREISDWSSRVVR